MELRFPRGMDGPKEQLTDEEHEAVFDWWARWRINALTVGSADPKLFAEARKRGMKLLIRLNTRNLCAADDKAVANTAAAFDAFLKAGGDGFWTLWDDLPRERVYGHCDKCRAKFGQNSMPKEIAHILEALVDVAAKYPEKKYLVWCPTHYNYGRYADVTEEQFRFGEHQRLSELNRRVDGHSPSMPDDYFFKNVATEKVRNGTYMCYCEFEPERIAFVNSFGIKNIVWWYNGFRSVYNILTRWAPPEPRMKLKIPDVVATGGAEFSRMDSGWLMGIGVKDDGTIIWATDAVKQDLRTLANRIQGAYLCGGAGAYHNALMGLYSFYPSRFDQRRADKLVFGSVFGPGSDGPGRRWQDEYSFLTAWLSKKSMQPFTDKEKQEAEGFIKQWQKDRSEFEAVAARKRTVLPAYFVDTLLSGVSGAEKEVTDIVQRLYSGTAKN